VHISMRAHGAGGQQGFSLVDLLITTVVVGVLAALAMPVFLGEREPSLRVAAESDLRNVVAVFETVYATSGVYPDPASDVVERTELSVDGVGTGSFVQVSKDVALSWEVTDGGRGFELTVTHAELGESVDYSSATGALGAWEELSPSS
jgi:type IV pilus assembly protein PilA